MDNRDIDKMVAEKVMELELHWKADLGDFYIKESEQDGIVEWFILPHYSARIEDAWQIVNHLLSTREGLVFHTMSPTPDRSNWYAGFGVQPPTDEVHFANAGTPSMAICLAALKCVGVEVEADSDPRP